MRVLLVVGALGNLCLCSIFIIAFFWTPEDPVSEKWRVLCGLISTMGWCAYTTLLLSRTPRQVPAEVPHQDSEDELRRRLHRLNDEACRYKGGSFEREARVIAMHQVWAKLQRLRRVS